MGILLKIFQVRSREMQTKLIFDLFILFLYLVTED